MSGQVYELEPIDLLEGLPDEIALNGIPGVTVSDDGRTIVYDYPDGAWSAFERHAEEELWRRLEERPRIVVAEPEEEGRPDDQVDQVDQVDPRLVELIEGLRRLKVSEVELSKISSWSIDEVGRLHEIMSQSRGACVERGYHEPRHYPAARLTVCEGCGERKPPLGEDPDLPWGRPPEHGDIFSKTTPIALRVIVDCPCGAHWLQLATSELVCTACGSFNGDLKVTPQDGRPAPPPGSTYAAVIFGEGSRSMTATDLVCCECAKTIYAGRFCWSHGDRHAHDACVHRWLRKQVLSGEIDGSFLPPYAPIGNPGDYCEWNPCEDRGAQEGDAFHAYAEVLLGAGGKWRVCRSCADSSPQFKRLRKRTAIPNLTQTQPAR